MRRGDRRKFRPVARSPKIRVEGTQRVEPETVRSYLLVQPGDTFDSDRIDRSLKALFATGLFADVALRRDGDALIVRVVENPIINRIAFEGNHKLSDQTLDARGPAQAARRLHPRPRCRATSSASSTLYRRNGRFAATVDPKVIPLEQNRVDLVFEIDEGPVDRHRGISFVGNHQFSASRLREIICRRRSRAGIASSAATTLTIPTA